VYVNTILQVGIPKIDTLLGKDLKFRLQRTKRFIGLFKKERRFSQIHSALMFGSNLKSIG
jgi:hypothetical protein